VTDGDQDVCACRCDLSCRHGQILWFCCFIFCVLCFYIVVIFSCRFIIEREGGKITDDVPDKRIIFKKKVPFAASLPIDPKECKDELTFHLYLEKAASSTISVYESGLTKQFCE
jgi:hypothetical protein